MPSPRFLLRSRPRRLALEVVGLALVFGLGSLAGPAIAANTAAVLQVMVVNPTSSPVPVAGTVGLSTSANTVKIDAAANTVTIGGTPMVNTSAADNPAFQAVSEQLLTSTWGGNIGAGTGTYTVPAGKELVVEQVSYQARVPSGEDIVSVELFADDATSYTELPVTHEALDLNPNITVVTGLGLTRAYFGPGKSIICLFTRNSTTSSLASSKCDVEGYLVTLQ